MGRNILLGVCGGISAYKSCELVREFQRAGCAVRVMMTKAAQEFVTKLSFEALTRASVATDLFSDEAFGTSHIELARWADNLVIAPATANTIANLAHGQAIDVVSTVALAYTGQLTLAPAMNTQMWNHVAVQTNLKLLQDRGAEVILPQEGELACGEIGIGKMAEPRTIVDRIMATTGSLQGKKVLVTAGATREYLDPVRFISNPSSGKMGLAIAHEAWRRGAEVFLVHGPLADTIPSGLKSFAITSAQEMFKQVQALLPADIFVGTAAVSDYTPVTPHAQKLKKNEERLEVIFQRTPDILAFAASHRRPQDVVIGFAAETENLIPHAKLKLESKGLDFMVGNYVAREHTGFVQDRTSVVFLDRTGVRAEWANVSKGQVAQHLWNEVEKLFS